MQAFVQGFVSQSAKLEPLDRFRRLRRSLDSNLTFRKFVVLVLVALVLVLYLGPAIFAYLFVTDHLRHPIAPGDARGSCLSSWLTHHSAAVNAFDAFLAVDNRESVKGSVEKSFLPFVGNGHVGLAVSDSSNLYIRGKRTLSARIPFNPLVYASQTPLIRSNASLLDVRQGVVERVECLGQNIFFSAKVFASRSIKHLLVQEISLVNPTDQAIELELKRDNVKSEEWPDLHSSTVTVEIDGKKQAYLSYSGPVFSEEDNNLLYKQVTLLVPKELPKIFVGARMSKTVHVFVSVAFSQSLKKVEIIRNSGLAKKIESEALEALKQGLRLGGMGLYYRHISAWQSTFSSGFGISKSMLEDAVNGDAINATMYYVLSHLSAPLHELHTTEEKKNELRAKIAYPEGCFNGLPTLQAKALWGDLSNRASVDAIVQRWLLTLEKNGCLKLLRAGADGGIQAMVLSLGSLLFKEEHLELNARPQDLHRDLFFRRISYNADTRLNVSIVVHEESNKANLYVGVENSGASQFYGCDAGCLDSPVALSSVPMHFPVKLTDPLTAILYVTADKRHMEELKHAIHVHEVVEAPAHEAHIIDQHRHGNRIGGLPTLFWLSLAVPVLMFHGFLFKLIWQEYCASSDKFRVRKFSDYE